MPFTEERARAAVSRPEHPCVVGETVIPLWAAVQLHNAYLDAKCGETPDPWSDWHAQDRILWAAIIRADRLSKGLTVKPRKWRDPDTQARLEARMAALSVEPVECVRAMLLASVERHGEAV